MRIDSIMTRAPLSVAPDAEPSWAIAAMDERDVRHLPVVEDHQLVGIVSDRDLLSATGGSPSSGGGPTERPGRDGLTIRDVMHSPVIAVEPGDTLVTASLDLVLRGVGCLPVVERGELVGIVTEVDLLRCFNEQANLGTLTGNFDPPIEHYMTTSLQTTTPNTTLDEAVRLIGAHRIRHLPVVDEKRLVGILSDRDLRLARGRGASDSEPVERIMTRDMLTVRPDALMSHASWMMAENRISSLPVVLDDELRGIITSTDVLEHCGHTLWEPS